MKTYRLYRAVRQLTGWRIFDPLTDHRAHRPDCGFYGPCDCNAHA